jgi:phage terminase large subunit GpA-like protein
VVIVHARLFGDVKDPHSEVWQRADWYRTKAFRHESGHDLHVQVCLVDSGDGDNTLAVYDWVLPRQRQNTFAIKGDRARAKPAILRPGKTKKRAGVRLFIIGVDALKTRLFNRLRIAAPEPGPDGRVPPTPGFLHFPQPQELGCDDTYLKQFGNEKLVPRRDKTGETVRRYVKTGPNEAVDLDVYALAGLHVLGDAVRLSLGTLAQALARPLAGSGSAPVRDGAERSRRVAAASPVDAVVRPPAPVAAPANAPAATGRRMRSGGVV